LYHIDLKFEIFEVDSLCNINGDSQILSLQVGL
jgi:hypothetical protein